MSAPLTHRVLAVLGPTNTGKTHFALDRMLGHASGMIGFPLRLLARENYDRIVRLKGAAQVALITGEEKIIPPRPRWYVCTVESMPLDRRVSFLAVDEIQLCSDPDRGHIFTDRLLHARGQEETLFLGAESIKPLMRRLIPGVEFITRPRLSKLTYAGPCKLNRLPPRSAVVAFSAAEVYGMAEYVRRHRGGAAVVLGALSPRTRNAQVELYQAGDVDYIIATDAIGMGLNMDVDHVAFAGLRKFDGRSPRDLDAAEIAQIAGRAGRHMNDGTFGTTADVGAIPADLVAAVEDHQFPPLKSLYWRNTELRFATVPALLAGLEKAPPQPGLIRTRQADDHLALDILAADPDILALANHPERIRLLWDVCQIPDFRKVMAESHTRLLGQIFKHLCGPGRRLPKDWLGNHIDRLDRVDGELETLLGRIAHIRTWTYVAQRSDWVHDPVHWQGVTRAIEDKLSDALHTCLTQKFVDRRTAHLVRRLHSSDHLLAAIARSGEVLVEGHAVGALSGFSFTAEPCENPHAAKAVLAAAARALKPEFAARVQRLCDDTDDAFTLDDPAMILWHGEPVGRVVAGSDALSPLAEMLPSDFLEPAQRLRISQHLTQWLGRMIRQAFAPLWAAHQAATTAPLRAIVHLLGEGMGCARRTDLDPKLLQLQETERHCLARLNIRTGQNYLFIPALFKDRMPWLRGFLWGVFHARPRPTAPLHPAFPMDDPPSKDACLAMGYARWDHYVVRVDVAERVMAQLRGLARAEPNGFALPPALLSATGMKKAHALALVPLLGYEQDAATGLWRPLARSKSGKKPKSPASGRISRPPDPDHPFAILYRRS